MACDWKEACWKVWLLACTRSPCLGIIYSLNGYFYSSSKQKLGEGLAKLRTAREAPSDCMCPPGRCKRTGTADTGLPGSRLPAAPTTDLLLSDSVPPYQGKCAKWVFFPSLKRSLVLETVDFCHCLALACLQIKEFEVWTKATFGYKNKRANSSARLRALGVGPKQFRSSNKITGA